MRGSLWSDIVCPVCGSGDLLKFRDNYWTYKDRFHYCPQCDTLFRDDSTRGLVSMAKTNRPYADWETLIKYS